nr:unnamed protein product [Callosobruchus analis]
MLEDLRQEPSGYFENFCRISTTDFEYLLNKIGPVIAKSNTNMRDSIPVQERLAVTLRFLATGDSFKSLSYLFKFSPQTVSRCIGDVCRTLIRELKDEIKLPETANEWRKIAEEFKNRWNFPNCLGAIDGKHIVIQSPLHSGTEFYNYKGTFSVVLMAVVNANYEFTYVDIGCQGRISDGGVFRNTSFYDKLSKDQLMLPAAYIFVGDDAFALTTRMLKPYPGVYNKGTQERIFNYRLSRARRVVENVFGILSSIFRIFKKPIVLEPLRVTEITMTCVLLHNLLRKSRTSRSRYMPPESLDSEVEGLLIPGLEK